MKNDNLIIDFQQWIPSSSVCGVHIRRANWTYNHGIGSALIILKEVES